jgi:hypothetical protein
MFNLNDYEDVATRIKRVHDNFPMVRFNIRELKVDHQAGYCYAVTEIYRDANDATPAAVDVAYEARSDRGVNRDFWVENCITSSYGRTAGLLLGTDKRPTRQDMEKAQSKIMEPVTSDINGTSRQAAEPVANAMALLVDQLGAEEISKPEICNHGAMVLKKGSKNGRDYYGYTCQLGKTSESCESVWYKIGADGKWHAPKKPAFEVKAGRSLVTEMLNGES